MYKIKVFILSIFLTMSFIAHAMEDEVDEATKRLERVLSLWTYRKEQASEYMNVAIKFDAIQIIKEEIEETTLITMFNPKTKKVNLQLGDLNESVEFNIFMRWLDTSMPQEKKSKKAFSKADKLSCGLQ